MLEEKIKKLIIDNYGSLRQFALKIDIPYTTIDSILKRGIDNSNVSNVIAMCKALGLSADKSIENNNLIFNTDLDKSYFIKNSDDIILDLSKKEKALEEKEKLEKFVLENDITLTLPTNKLLTAEEYININNKINSLLLSKMETKTNDK